LAVEEILCFTDSLTYPETQKTDDLPEGT